MAGVSLEDARLAGSISTTAASSGPARYLLQGVATLSDLARLPLAKLVYWSQQEPGTPHATLAPALDQLALVKAIGSPDATNRVFGSLVATSLSDSRTSTGVVQWLAREVAQHKPRWVHCGDRDGLGLGEYAFDIVVWIALTLPTPSHL